MTYRPRPALWYLPVLFLLIVADVDVTRAQQLQPRFGAGFNAMASTVDGAGLGLRGRVSIPVNSDLSIGGDLGFTGFIFGGRRGATWIFDPQISAIITLPPSGRGAAYVFAGVGAYSPVSNQDDSESGPTVHFGVGRVVVLRETTIFYEINPALILGLDAVNLALPLRAGIIF